MQARNTPQQQAYWSAGQPQSQHVSLCTFSRQSGTLASEMRGVLGWSMHHWTCDATQACHRYSTTPNPLSRVVHLSGPWC
eukprot:4512141-Alexandrium_andersonii.AAC.1